MKRHLFMYPFLLILLTTIITNTALGDAPIPQHLFVANRSNNAFNADAGALYYSNWFLSPKFSPPAGSHFTLIPRTQGDECDILRMSYQVGDKSITVSQVRYMMLCQIDLSQKTTQLLQVSEVKSLMSGMFQNIDIDKHFIAYDVASDTMKPVTNPLGTGTSWWQTFGRIGFYQVKDDGKVNSLVPTLLINTTAYWFTNNESNDTQPKTEDPQVILDQMVSPRDTPDIDRLKQEAFEWVHKHLTTNYQLPQNLEYCTIPESRMNGMKVVQARYEVGNEIITIAKTQSLSAVQVEEKGFDIKSPLSDDGVKALAEKLFNNIGDLRILTTNATASTAEGIGSGGKDSKAQWPSSFHWQQDTGRVIFYFSNVSK